MPEIIITINERPYTMACEEGQQAHIKHLAQTIDQHIQHLISSFGQIGDQRLLLMTALDLADELVKKQAGQPDRANTVKQNQKMEAGVKQDHKILVESMDKISTRLEKLAEKFPGSAQV